MSVIYESLQAVEKEEAGGSSQPAPGVVASGSSGIILRGFGVGVVFILIVVSGIYLFSQSLPETRKIAQPPKRPVEQAKDTSKKIVAKENVSEQKKLTPAPAVNVIRSTPDTNTLVEQHIYRKAAPDVVNLEKPTQALENHFADQAKKNEKVLALERKLRVIAKQGDVKKSKTLIRSMDVEIGKKNTLSSYKWEGYLALKSKNYAKAEKHFRRALAMRSTDLNSNINLAYALFGQGKRVEASKIYEKIATRHPMDENVQKLGQVLGML